jgi:hypothetical protein
VGTLTVLGRHRIILKCTIENWGVKMQNGCKFRNKVDIPFETENEALVLVRNLLERVQYYR